MAQCGHGGNNGGGAWERDDHDRSTPVEVSWLNGVIAIAAGQYFSLA